jgi:hypothetical protein
LSSILGARNRNRRRSQKILPTRNDPIDGKQTAGNVQMRVSCTFAETETLLYNNRPDRSQYRTCSKRRPSLKGVYKKKKKRRVGMRGNKQDMR